MMRPLALLSCAVAIMAIQEERECPQCKAKCRIDASFCGKCGSALGIEESTRITVVAPSEKGKQWMADQLRSRINLAYVPLGTRVEADPPLEESRKIHDQNSDTSVKRPSSTYTVTLSGGAARIDTVALFLWNEETRITVEGSGSNEEYRSLTTTSISKQEEGCFWLAQFAPIALEGVRIRIEAGHDLAEIFLLEEAGLATASRLSQGGMNIAARPLGGSLFDLPEGLVEAASVYDADPETATSFSPPEGGSISLTFAFAGNQEALVQSVAIAPARREGEENVADLPDRLRVWASRESPFAGYRFVGEYRVPGRGGEQLFKVEEAIRTRFLKIEMLPRAGRTEIEVGEISIYEGSASGYVSVLLRGRDFREPRAGDLESLIAGAKSAPEEEPNDDVASATPLSFGQWIRGGLEGPRDRDVIRLKVSGGKKTELELHMLPFLRARLRVLNSVGEEVSTIPMGSGHSMKSPLSLEEGSYFLELASVPVYVLLAYDTSVSMTDTVETTNEAIAGWADHLPAGFFVATAVTRRPSPEQMFTILCPFTEDPATLKEGRIDWERDQDGLDEWFDLIPAFLKYLEREVPPEAIAALVYTSDGNGFGDFHKLWESLRRTRARLYTIGFGEVGTMIDPHTGWDGGRGLYNIAWFRSGRYYAPMDLAQVRESYDRVFEDLRTEAVYALRVVPKEMGVGTITGEAPLREGRPIHFILDASGSMSAKVGEKTRLEIAKETIGKVLAKVQSNDSVGLRVFGHRYREVDSKRAPTDSELLIPIEPLDRGKFSKVLDRIEARGGTPLAYSISEAIADLQEVSKPRVVFITDGVDSFRGDAIKAAQGLAKAVPDMDLVVIGFGMGVGTDQDSLRKMAETARGRYFDATDAGSFLHVMEEALHPTLRYVLWDGAGRKVLEGQFGDTHTVTEGEYTCVYHVDGREVRLPVLISPGEETRLEFPK